MNITVTLTWVQNTRVARQKFKKKKKKDKHIAKPPLIIYVNTVTYTAAHFMANSFPSAQGPKAKIIIKKQGFCLN